MNDASFDRTYAAQYGIVCGTDEAGRGPLAGPVVAAAVVLPEGLIIDGLDDSKKLTEKKREKLYDEIIEKALAFGIAQAVVFFENQAAVFIYNCGSETGGIACRHDIINYLIKLTDIGF